MKQKCIIKRVKRLIALTLCLILTGNMTVSAANIYFEEGNIGEYNNSLSVAKQIEAEGIVLLENDGGLPLAKGSEVSVFGCGSIDPFLGGGGAGNIVSENTIGFYEALEQSGINYHQDLYEYYRDWYEENKSNNEYIGDDGAAGQTLLDSLLAEMPFEELDQDVWESAVDDTDTAIFVISRAGSEQADVTLDTLKLRNSEKEMLDQLDENFDNIIVLFNICNVMEMEFLDDYNNIKAAAIIWAPGEAGMESVGKMLAGDVNPSGKLADTIAHHIEDHPSTLNFGNFKYDDSNHTFVSYEEGIYVGYRYFETFDVEVRYPFGYGLSYTTFDWSVGTVKDLGNTLSIDVTVTNKGNMAGKDVVQIYYTAPYTNGGIEKSAIELGGYAKTKELQPNESVTVTITIDKYYMSSYDMDKEQYVLDAGNYTIKTARSVQDIVNTQTIAINGITYSKDPVTGTGIKNQFPQASETSGLTVLSRENGKTNETFPTAPSQEKGDYAVPAALADIDKRPAPVQGNPETDAPKFGRELKSGVMTLKDLYKDAYVRAKNDSSLDLEDAVYNSPLWTDFLSQITLEEAIDLIIDCGYKTPGLDRLGIPRTYDNDGPASVKGGVNSIMEIMGSLENVGPGYPIATAVACTWNDELANEYGVRAGVDASIVNTNVWYAPGTNTHRNPMGGRNFEYFSEDPLLAGKMAAAITSGAQSQGLIVTVKHFALNDQEFNRMRVFTWADEQSIREIYLKSFEISIKEGGANGVMSSFNRIGMEYAGACDSLLNQVLRHEWGFRGFVVTDQYLWMMNPTDTYMNPVNILYGGGDALLSGLFGMMPNTKDLVVNEIKSGYEADKIGLGNAIQSAVKHLCFMKMSTNAFDDMVKVHTVTFKPENGNQAATVFVADGDKVTASAAPVKEGYIFAGWYAEGAAAVFNFDTKITSDITLTAKWTAKPNLSKAKITAADKVYNGKEQKPKVTVKFDGKTLKEGTDYTVSYKSNKNIGTATVTVTGKGNYTGSNTVKFKINPKKVTSVKAVSKKTKQVKISWKKDNSVSGYQIYCKKYNSKKWVSVKKVTKNKTISFTHKKLKSKKKYQYKVRAYKKVGKITYYGAFSAVRKVNVK